MANIGAVSEKCEHCRKYLTWLFNCFDPVLHAVPEAVFREGPEQLSLLQVKE